jgi:hypothetical protein
MSVEVDADKNGIAVTVSDGAPFFEGYKSVGATSHAHGDSFGFEEFLNLEGHLERELLFINTTSVASFVFSSVAGVDNDSGNIARLSNSGDECADQEKKRKEKCAFTEGVTRG